MHITEVQHAGFKLCVRVNTPWLDLNVATEVISNDTYDIGSLSHMLTNPNVILDVGGHIGCFGLYAKHFWPDALLIAIEPSRENAYLYEMNMKLNGIRNYHILLGGVQYDCKKNCLLYSANTTGGYLMRSPEEAARYIAEGYRFYDRILEDEVEIYTIGQICDMFNIEHIDLAKWDCEGCEVDAFLSMPDYDAERFRFMVGEYHIWTENGKYLKPDIVDCIRFWKRVKRKFAHLNFYYKNNALGQFGAWPK